LRAVLDGLDPALLELPEYEQASRDPPQRRRRR
jgi:hypothetical protein